MITTVPAPALARGYHEHLAEGPLYVSDPLKARHLLGLETEPPSVRARKRHALGIMPVSYFRRAVPQLAPSALRELERLLTGGDVLWHEGFANLVVNQGLNDLLNVTLSGDTQDTTWFVGLMSGTPTAAAGDTLASHAGWTEITNYDETNRVAYVDNGNSSAQSLTNSSAPSVFTISATVTIGGSFLAGVNTGTGGRLYSAGAFTGGNKSLNDNDTLSVTMTFTTAAA